MGAAFIHPDTRAVIPRMPAPLVKQDGSENNDGERQAAQRFVTKFRRDHPHLKVLVTAASLRSNAPHIETVHAPDRRSILGVKEGEHALLCAHVAEAEQAGRVTYDDREDRHQGMPHRFRFVCGMPLNASQPARRVNCIECGETVKGKVQHGRWVTDLRVNKGTVYRIMQGARARWRLAHEPCNTLQNQGDHFEHHFGHGYEQLSVVCAELMRWAFVVDQGQQWCCPLCQEARAQWGSTRLLWETMRALCFDYALASMRALCEALVYGLKQSAPILATDSS